MENKEDLSSKLSPSSKSMKKTIKEWLSSEGISVLSEIDSDRLVSFDEFKDFLKTTYYILDKYNNK